MERAVVDASVVVKWFVSEKDTDKALSLRQLYLNGSLELLAPTLIYYEVAYALRFHPHYRLTEAELVEAISKLKDMQIAVEPTIDTWSKTFEISKSEDISIYDAIYVSVSALFDAEMVTGDTRLLEGLSENVKKRMTLLNEINP